MSIATTVGTALIAANSFAADTDMGNPISISLEDLGGSFSQSVEVDDNQIILAGGQFEADRDARNHCFYNHARTHHDRLSSSQIQCTREHTSVARDRRARDSGNGNYRRGGNISIGIDSNGVTITIPGFDFKLN